jgi:hypothetical protein
MTLEEASAVMESVGVTAPKELDGTAVAVALPIIAKHLRRTRTGLSMAGIDGAPDWLGYESDLWKLSGRLRPVLSARKDWRSGSDVLKALALICNDQSYSKGRQYMIMMLGEFGGTSEATEISALLDDPEVQGHVYKALTKLRDTRHQGTVERLVPKLSGWVKAAAKKYVALSPAK